MDFLSILGSLGIGLVWGWLAGFISFRAPHISSQNVKAWIALGSGTVALWGTLGAFLGWRLAIIFLIGASVSYLIHHSWRNSLQQQVTRRGLPTPRR
jgi:prepilin signal peptidase PulO-like enzyme (type II secretory pathway)